MEEIKLKYVEISLIRAFMSLISLIAIGSGLYMIYGIAITFIGVGFILYVDVSIDEILERITGIKRGKP